MGGRRKHRSSREAKQYSRYGITGTEREALSESQGNLCMICTRKAALQTDHSHTTKRVRGLLCRECNVGVGMLRDDPRLLRRAAAYVQAFQINPEQAHHTLLTLRKAGGF